MSIIHKGGMDPAEFAGRTMYRVMETKQMQKEAVFGGGQSEGASGWTEASGQGAEHPAEDQRDEIIKRSEGGPGRGYYLNGVFHPYSEEEDN